MKLCDAILQAVKIFGPNCLSSNLYNAVSDFSGYDVPSTKQILKHIVQDGFGAKILQLYNEKQQWETKMQALSSEFIVKTGFKDVLVAYVFHSIEYGLGWMKSEPLLNAESVSVPAKDYSEDLSNVNLDKQLILMQKEYIAMLNSLIVIPEGKLYKKSGYYPIQAKADLWVVEHKIDIISTALGQDNSSWCSAEREKILKQYQINTSRQFGAVFIKVIFPIIVLLSLALTGLSYLSSRSDISQYDSTIALGDDYFKKGDYAEAIAYFSKASNNYNGSFCVSQKKNYAFSKAVEAANSLVDATILSAHKLAENGHYFDAKQTLCELEQYAIDDSLKNKISSYQHELESEIWKAILYGKNSLLASISSNGRKLDSSSIEMLNELLKVAPDDYWLNFILQKSK